MGYKFKAGDRVRITKGSYKDLVGTIRRINNYNSSNPYVVRIDDADERNLGASSLELYNPPIEVVEEPIPVKKTARAALNRALAHQLLSNVLDLQDSPDHKYDRHNLRALETAILRVLRPDYVVNTCLNVTAELRVEAPGEEAHVDAGS